MSNLVRYAASAAMLGLPVAGAAQETAPPASEPEIVVTAPGERGAVIGRTPPDIRLERDDIATYGAGNTGELLQALAPQTGERPVILVNGRRVAGVQDISRLPPEAIERVDILPPEVALSYGYPADQRVVNIVLVTRFTAVTGEVQARAATAGGRSGATARANAAWIDGDRRSSLDIEYARDTALTEAERNLAALDAGSLFDPRGNVTGTLPGGEIDPALSALAGANVTVAGVPASAANAAPGLADFLASANAPNLSDLGRSRSLLPASHKFALGGALSRRLTDAITGTLTTRLEFGASRALLGLGGAALTVPAGNPFSPFAEDVTLWRAVEAPGALVGATTTRQASLGLALNGRTGPWTWFVQAAYENSRSRAAIDLGVDAAALQAALDAGDPARNPFGALPAGLAPIVAQTTIGTQSNVNLAATASAPVLRLPAGNLAAVLSAGFSAGDFKNRLSGAGADQVTRLASDQTQGRVNLSIPLTSRRRAVLAAIGDLTANLGASADHLAGIGAATSFSYGLTWEPIRRLRLGALVTEAQSLPPALQRGAPILTTPNVPFYDAATGASVDVTRIDGGNPALGAERRHLVLMNSSWRPFADLNLSLDAQYTSASTRDAVGALNVITPEVEAAFPDRFERDAEGRLTAVDLRPVNFARARTARLTWGLSFAMPLAGARPAPAPDEAPPPDIADGMAGGAPPDAGADMAAHMGAIGGPPARPGAPPGRARLLLSLSHSWRLADDLTIAAGLPPIDLLASPTAAGRGPARHELNARANLVMGGIGASLVGSWESGGTRGDGAAALRFSDLATLDLRLFADLGQVAGAGQDWLRGARLSVEVANLFDGHVRVRDASGDTPLAFAPDRIDPLGRTVRLTLRKQI